MKFIVTNAKKLNDIEIVSGQLIFVRDERIIYLDSDIRTPFTQMIYVSTEAQRQTIASPLKGFYFVEETSILWHFDKTKGWEQITSAPDERLVFDTCDNFPAQGKTGVLYCAPNAIYQWNTEAQSYIEMGKQIWEDLK